MKFLASRMSRGYGGRHSPHKKARADVTLRFDREKSPGRVFNKLGGVPIRVGGDVTWQRPPKVRP